MRLRYKLLIACLSVLLVALGTLHFASKQRSKILEAQAIYKAIIQKEKTLGYIREALISEKMFSFPEAYCYAPLYYDFSRLYFVDWTWGAAVTWVESRCDPTLTSKAKALGLMQLMEQLCQAYCDTLGIEYVKGVTRWRDPLNLYIGLRFLGTSIRQYGIDSGLVVFHLGEPDMLAGKKKISGEEFKTLVKDRQTHLSYLYEGIIIRSK